MSDVLNKAMVLVLNRNWQAIHVRTPAEAFCQMATGAATALEIEGEEYIRPVTWAEWITLPVREQDQCVRTARGAIRVPTVIVAVNFDRVPKKRPKLCAKTIRERDGNRCQYTGR
ncbi:MAG: HNH endonuclease, partial [Verrucomicrobiota bacterium]